MNRLPHHAESRMQPPTCMGIRIRSVQDAHIVFHAVMTGLLPMVTRRLDTEERRAVRSGNVYVWEERGRHTEATGLGIERWTDGIRWSASRVRDEFLLYHERDTGVDIDYGDMDGYGSMDGSASSQLADMRASNRLVKQTYSVFVNTSQGRRKWHLTAYYVPSSLTQLRTVDDLPQLAAVRPPEGMYTSAKVGKSRALPGSGNSDIHMGAVGMPNQMHQHPPTYAPFPNGPPGPLHHHGHHPHPHPLSSPGSSPTSPLAHRQPTWPLPNASHRESNVSSSSRDAARTLPGLPSLGLTAAPPVQSPYSPRHPLDDEALRSLNRSI
ncbi:hypothetical protein SCHPADRAFT_905772 [Schizopora paradoxa]|uniref:cAMP-independent regulatory protein pac2 n=1 Tax=Schizopora paradoxa TaxID=27342 RepID=A0A0H2RJD0_9AGAM|nr:hypothetical protein SCHPADRAFT_905772 [Schizopora paradoxa]